MKNCRKGASIHRIAKVRIPFDARTEARGMFYGDWYAAPSTPPGSSKPGAGTRAVWDSWLYLRQ